MRRLSDSLPMLLLRAREATLSHFRPALKDFGLTELQWRVLRVLDDCGEVSAQQLAELDSNVEAYEDWYIVENFSSLDHLNDSAAKNADEETRR